MNTRLRGSSAMRAPFLHRVRLAPRLLRTAAAHVHVLEGLDLLRHAVFEQLEVGRREVPDRLAVDRRVDVHAHEVGFDAERGLPLPGCRALPARRRATSPARIAAATTSARDDQEARNRAVRMCSISRLGKREWASPEWPLACQTGA